jgi:hypothetical protein
MSSVLQKKEVCLVFEDIGLTDLAHLPKELQLAASSHRF